MDDDDRWYPSLVALPGTLAAQVRAQPVLELPAGVALFEEHSPCAGFPLVLGGAVEVHKQAANGRRLRLYSVLPGESCVITQACLLGQVAYRARGVTREPSRLRVLPTPLFDALLAQHPPFRRFVFGLFAERMAELMTLVEEVAFQRLDQRLARVLIERGPLLKTTHQGLADDLGSVREIVTRVLREFAEEGLVALRRECVEVLDIERLAERAV